MLNLSSLELKQIILELLQRSKYLKVTGNRHWKGEWDTFEKKANNPVGALK